MVLLYKNISEIEVNFVKKFSNFLNQFFPVKEAIIKIC